MTALLSRGYRFASGRPASGGDGLSLPPVTFGAAGTIEARCRLRPTTHGSGRRILNFEAAGRVLELAYNATAWTARVYDVAVVDRQMTSAGVNPVDGPEHVASLVWDAAGARLYVDGVLVASSNGATAWTAWTSATSAIGNYSPSPTQANGTEGWISDVRLWDRALTVAELAPFRPQLRGDEAGLLGWWPLEGDTVDRAVHPVAITYSAFSAGELSPSTDDALHRPWVNLAGFVPTRKSDGVMGVSASGTFAGAGSRAYDSGLADGRFTWRIVTAGKAVQNQFGGTFRRSLTVNDRWSWWFYNTPGANGSIYLYKTTVAGGDAGYSLAGVGSNADPNVPHTVVVECVGPLIRLFMDGVLLGSVVDATHQTLTGVGALFYGGDLGVGWDFIGAEPISGRAVTLDGSAKNGARPAILRAVA